MNISQGLLPFQLIQDASKVLFASFGGLPLVMDTFRALGLRRTKAFLRVPVTKALLTNYRTYRVE